jgi:hypothetical protein
MYCGTGWLTGKERSSLTRGERPSMQPGDAGRPHVSVAKLHDGDCRERFPDRAPMKDRLVVHGNVEKGV